MPDLVRESTPPTPPPQTSLPHDLPPVDEGDHALREVYLAYFRERDRATLGALHEFLLDVLIDGAPATYLPGGHLPNVADGLAAVARDLRFTARYLVGGLARAAADYDEVALTGFAVGFAPKVDALAAEVEEFLAACAKPEALPS